MAKATKPKRRRAMTGAGSVYPTAEGRYRGALVLKDPLTGKRSRRVVSARTEQEAQAKLDELRAVTKPTTTMQVGKWLAYWLPTTRLRVAPSTYRGYASVAKAITAQIGTIGLDRLTATDVERMTTAMQSDGKSARTAAMARKVLRVALRQALRDRLVSVNVAAVAMAPRVPRFVPRPLTADEARALIAGTLEDPDGPLWALLVTTGLRLGEAAGLSWADVREDRLRVARSLSKGWDGRPELGPPKSERSRRFVPLGRDAREALKRQRARQDELRATAGTAWDNPDDLVFTDAVGHPIRTRDAAGRLHEATDRLKLPRCRVHDLRHSAASLMVAQGVPLTTVSRVLGHSTIAITFDTYSTLTEDVEQAAADALDRALGGTK